MKTFVCPTCSRTFSTKSRPKHTAACAKRPSDAQLRLDWEDGLSYTALGRKYSVCHKTAKKWCVELELGVDGEMDRTYKDEFKVYPELAYRFGAHVLCVTGKGDKKVYCPHHDWCTHHQREWVKCEAPDGEQLAEWERYPSDYHDLHLPTLSGDPHDEEKETSTPRHARRRGQTETTRPPLAEASGGVAQGRTAEVEGP